MQQYYQQLYSKQFLATYETEWCNYIENKTQIYQRNRIHENDEYNQPIQLNKSEESLRFTTE